MARGQSKRSPVLRREAGKTRTAVDFLLAHVVARKVRLWLAHRKELVDQAIATLATRSHLANMDFDIGRFGPKNGSRTNEIVRVLVGSVPTLIREENLEQAWRRQGGFDLVVVDECHHAPARTSSSLLERLMARSGTLRILGLSATPLRRTEDETNRLWSLFGTVIYEAKPRDLIDQGYLARLEIVQLATGQAFDATPAEVKSREESGDLPQSLIRRIAENELRNRFVADAIHLRARDWGKTLIFTATVRQADALQEQLRDRGVVAGIVTSLTEKGLRASEVDKFRSGRLQVLINVNVLAEGTDLPRVDTVVLARPTRSQVLFQQMVGRRGRAEGGWNERLQSRGVRRRDSRSR